MNNKDKKKVNNLDNTLTHTMSVAAEKENSAAPVDTENLALIKESYKATRTNLILSFPKGKCHKIIITSSTLGEGKSTTSANLAISLAQTDKKVLLIDADLRKPSIYGTMGFSNDPGFSNVLTGLCTLEEAVNKTAFPNLDVLCAGISVPNPGELLACEATAKFIESLEEMYDYILFDTPPINIVSDALPLIRISDGTVLVVRQNYSTYPEITRAKKSIEFIGGKFLGIILNDVKDERLSKNNYGRYVKYYK